MSRTSRPARPGRRMPVKYWSRAGLMLTYWCNARCASCYVCCAPDRREEMSVAEALAWWGGLGQASPHGCRIHLTGGEPFGNWPDLIQLCRRARRMGLLARAPLDAIETNAFWATCEPIVRERVAALDGAGIGKLVISADPYHQQFVPIERCRLAARVAEEILGAPRVQVRWRDWLIGGFDTDKIGDVERARLFAEWADKGRDRFNGRAADELAWRRGDGPPASFACNVAGEFADKSCGESLLRSRHVHVDPAGRVMPGTCAGIVLGKAAGSTETVGEMWRRLDADHEYRPIVGTLSREGPAGLVRLAQAAGFGRAHEPPAGYAGKCHLCWTVRRFLARRGRYMEELGPAWMYEQTAVR